MLFIVKERLLDRGFRIAFWWTRFLPDFSGDELLLAGTGAEQKEKVLGSAVASASVVVASAVTSLVTVVSGSASLAPSVVPGDSASEAREEAGEGLETMLVELVGSLTSPAVFEPVEPTGVTIRTSDFEHSTDRVVDEL